MPPAKPAYDIDWLLASGSNVHACNHKDWYSTYTPFNTFINPIMGGGKIDVIGIGDVTLPTKTHKTRTGAAYHGKVVLRDVLHAPTVFCNLIGSPLHNDYNGTFGGSGGKILERETGRCVGIIDLTKLYRLRLKGQSATQTSLDPAGTYCMSVLWPDKPPSAPKPGQITKAATVNPPYSQSEKQWLKEKWGDEYHFLRSYELSIYKEEDREEGRIMVRAFMQDDADEKAIDEEEQRAIFRENHGEDEDDEDEDGNSENSFMRELEEDPMSHLADYLFSESELDWIKAHWQHSGNFLRCYGLKPYDDEDCQEGKTLVQEFMRK